MYRQEFLSLRKRLNKTQKEMSYLLGTSVKAIHSYEQGWRRIPSHVQRQLYFLLFISNKTRRKIRPCWVVKKCTSENRKKCPAWEFKAGRLCWFINGTICEGRVFESWEEKMQVCRSCEVLISLLHT